MVMLGLLLSVLALQASAQEKPAPKVEAGPEPKVEVKPDAKTGGSLVSTEGTMTVIFDPSDGGIYRVPAADTATVSYLVELVQKRVKGLAPLTATNVGPVIQRNVPSFATMFSNCPNGRCPNR
jgi:hypothetical protein